MRPGVETNFKSMPHTNKRLRCPTLTLDFSRVSPSCTSLVVMGCTCWATTGCKTITGLSYHTTTRSRTRTNTHRRFRHNRTDERGETCFFKGLPWCMKRTCLPDFSRILSVGTPRGGFGNPSSLKDSVRHVQNRRDVLAIVVRDGVIVTSFYLLKELHDLLPIEPEVVN